MHRYGAWFIILMLTVFVGCSTDVLYDPNLGPLIYNLQQVALAVLAVLGAALEVLRRRAQGKAVRARREAEDLKHGMHAPVRVSRGEKRHSIVLLGIGGSGKTHLIKSLVGDPAADPEQKTQQYSIYHSRQTVTNDPAPRNLYISDYVGQNLGSLVRAFIEQQFEPYSAMAYGHITAVILVVDLIPPPNTPDEMQHPQHLPDIDRIQEQDRQWNDTALDAISGLLTNSLKLFCIFINKCDLVQTGEPDCRRAYSSLIARVTRRFSSADVRVFVGSAKKGQGVILLQNQLLATAVVHG